MDRTLPPTIQACFRAPHRQDLQALPTTGSNRERLRNLQAGKHLPHQYTWGIFGLFPAEKCLQVRLCGASHHRNRIRSPR